jgi:hypothetical protein
VLLQGGSEQDYAALVDASRANGAEITHRLPLIHALGARVTRDQLDTLREQPALLRLIDDLDAIPPEEDVPPQANDCRAAGSLELAYAGSSVSWRLYNKGEEPLTLSELHVRMPDSIAPPFTATWADKSLPLIPGDAEHRFRPDAEAILPAGGNLTLSLQLSRTVAAASHPQSSFDLEAHFGESCSVELIPGYPDNRVDTYYPTVTGADLLHQHGVTGLGVTVAVLDSGLWETEALRVDTRGEPRVVARYDAIADREGEAHDESGHGTHMSSIIAQSGRAGGPSGDSYRGIAPDARLVAVKAFAADGQGDFLHIIRGLQWVHDKREELDIRVLNLSFAARPRWPYWQDPINQAVMRLWRAGIVVVAAAGNEGPDSMTVGSPGNLPYVITVGSVTDSWTVASTDDDYIPDFSSRGPTPSGHIKPDIVAPGGHMSGITRPGSTLAREFPEYFLSTGDFVMTGTSQSAALVSGLAALLLQVEPTLTPDDLKCALTSSANPAINRDGRLSYSPFQQGTGYVDIRRAITLGERGCGNAGMDIDADIEGEQYFTGPAVFDKNAPPTLPELDKVYAGKEPEKGPSQDRRWGIKAHIERSHPLPEPASNAVPDWAEIYLLERSLIEALKREN